MEIRDARPEDIDAYIELCRKSYKRHNVFTREKSEIRGYLQQKIAASLMNGLLVASDDNILGGALIEQKELAGSHARFQINHLVGSEAAKKALLSKAINFIQEIKEIKSAKIEVKLADGENDEDLYLSFGFSPEGTLTSHYRRGEKVRILGLEVP